jgi:predicted amidophosphoribosyltransferase
MHSLLRPPACLACGLAGAWPCCAACLPPRRGPLRPGVLAADPAVLLWSLGPYRTALREAVTAGKLRGQRAALDVLGRGLGARLAAAGVAADLVTWVPSRPWPLGPRDHARVLAEAVAGALGLPVVHLLGIPPSP